MLSRLFHLQFLIAFSICIASFLGLLSAVKTSLRTQTALEIAQWALAAIITTRVHVLHVLAAATIQGWHLFCSELPIVWLLSRVAYNQIQKHTLWWKDVTYYLSKIQNAIESYPLVIQAFSQWWFYKGTRVAVKYMFFVQCVEYSLHQLETW